MLLLMSQPPGPFQGPLQPQYISPPQPPKQPKRFGWIAAGLFALGGLTVGGLAAGTTATNSAASMPAPVPTATVTTTTPAEEVETTPQSCLDALDYADEGFGYASKVIGHVRDAIDAIMIYDVAGVRRSTVKIEKVSDKMGNLAPKYNSAKSECRASA